MCRVVAGGAVRSDVRVYMGSGSLWRVNHLGGSCVRTAVQKRPSPHSETTPGYTKQRRGIRLVPCRSTPRAAALTSSRASVRRFGCHAIPTYTASSSTTLRPRILGAHVCGAAPLSITTWTSAVEL